MRVLFVSSTVTGGSGKSQRQLGKRLVEAGHEVRFVVDDKTARGFQRKVYEKLVDLEVRTSGWPIEGLVAWVASVPGRRMGSARIDGAELNTTYAPENAVPEVLHGWCPSVVVGSSVDRVTWRKVSRSCDDLDIPTVLYIREEVALGHLTISKIQPDLLLANAASLAMSATELGYHCAMVPSVVELSAARTTTTREVALLINPIPSHGVDVGLELASRHPDIEFVFQESWTLSPAQRGALDLQLSNLPNVELRERTEDISAVYRDAKVLLVPHRVDNRPRVIAEAQSNGIPVLASDEPGLIESVGHGGRIHSVDEIDQWSRSLTELWADPELESQLSGAARTHSEREELDPVWVTQRFSDLVMSVEKSSMR